jgi:hypothetical protein
MLPGPTLIITFLPANLRSTAMHHKRGKPKSSRAGCLLCYPHKHQGCRKAPRSKRAQAILAEPINSLLVEAKG